VGTTSGVAGADSYGADGPGGLIGISSNFNSQSDTTADSSGNFTVHGEFGTLVINADGSYTYTLDANSHGGGNDVFTYTITDGDGDQTTATLTIDVPSENIPPIASDSATTVSEEALASGNHDLGGSDSDTNEDVATITVQNTDTNGLHLADADGDTLTVTLGTPTGSYTSGGQTVNWAVSLDGHTLTGYTGSDPSLNHVVVVTIDNSGNYSVQLLQAFDDPSGNGENSINFVVPTTVDDGHGGTATPNITVTVQDDTPIANNDTDTLDSNLTATGNVITGVGTTSGVAGADSFGADGPGGLIGISSNFNSQSDTTFDGSGNLTVHGEFGTLTIKADGSYTYTLDANSHGGGSDVFTYTITDGDGDQTTATLTIGVPSENIPPIASDSSVTVSEEALASGNHDLGGSDSDTDSTTASGTISPSDANGDTLTVTLGTPTGNYTSGGQTVNWSVSPDGHTLTGYTGGDPSLNHVVVVTIANDGSYDVQLVGVFDDPNPGEDSINFVVPATVDDGHGGTTVADITVTVQDDTPIAQLSGNGVGTVTLDESAVGTDTPGGSPPVGTSSATINLTAGFVTGSSVLYGADGPGSVSYALHLSGSNVGSGLYALDPTDTSTSDGDGYGQGAQIVLNQSGNTITGSVGSTVYFTITINPITGVATFTQMNNIWNPVAGSSAAALDDTATLTTALASALQVVQTVTDGDGDTATASINIGQGVFQIEDSGPTAITPESIQTTDSTQGPIYAYLDTDHSVIENFGTDGPGTITFANITNGMDSGLTSGGTEITYWLSADGQTLDGRINSTDGTDGTLIFAVHIDQSTSQYDYTQYNIVDNGSGISFNDLTSTNAGNVDYRGVGADSAATPVDLLISGTQADGTIGTVNTDNIAIGIANQSMDAGETARIDFVTGLTSGAVTPTGFNFTGHTETSGFIGLIPQVQGAQSTTVSFTVYALESTLTGSGTPDSNPAGGGFSDSTIVQVTSVYVQDYLTGNTATLDITGLLVGSTTAVGFGISVTKNADGSVTFSGVQEGDHYGVNTGSNTFNAIAVHDVSGSFDLGTFSLTQTNTGNPVNLSYDLQIKDADGDTVALPGAINIELDPTGSASSAATTLTTNSVTANSVTTNSGGSGHNATGNLVSSNDNRFVEHERFAAGHNAALMAAIAAAGLDAEHMKLDFHAFAADLAHSSSMTPLQSATLASAAIEASSSVAPTHIVQPVLASDPSHSPQHGGHSLDVVEQHAATHGDGKQAPGITELLHGSAAPGHSLPANASAVTAAAVTMPSAHQLAAAMGAHVTAHPQSTVAGDGGQNSQVVGKVLADSLHGGQGHGPNIDALINGLPGHGGSHDVLEALASHGEGAVSFGHMAFATAYGAAHAMLSLEMMQHAAPPPHG